MLLQAKDYWQLPESRKEGPSPRAVRESMALLTPGFYTFIIQNWEIINIYCFKPPGFVMVALETTLIYI